MRAIESALPPGVACERSFQVILDGEARPLLCRWFVPEPHPKGDWICRVELAWPDGRVQKTHAGGADSTQALLLAFEMTLTRLLHGDFPVFWFEEDDSLGLPSGSYHAEQLAERKARFEGK